jgi:rhamnosyltransferase
MKIIGIVVLYHPPTDVVDNILSYICFLDKLIVWNNSLHPEMIFPEKYRKEEEKIIKMGDGTNAGLGVAYNSAVNYALKQGYDYLLTMDQDSRFKSNGFQEYIHTITKLGEKTIFSSNYIVHDKEMCVKRDSLIEVETSMSSGTVYPVCIFKEIGLFRGDFFIDMIDIEFSLRAKKNHIPTKMISSVYLIHGAGYQKKKYKFLWKTFSPNEYSSVRSYYIIRNGLITKRLYPQAKYWKGWMYYWFYKRLFFVLCYEKNKYAKWKGLLRGYIHGKMRRYA